MALPLTLRKDIRDNEAALKAAVDQFAAPLGFPVTLEANNEAIFALLTKANHAKKEAFTQVTIAYLNALFKQIDLLCKQPLLKEELARVMSAKKIVFELLDGDFGKNQVDYGGSSYTGVQFKDGALHIVQPVKNYWCNMDQLGKESDINITNVLARSCTPEGQLPITLRVNIAKAEPKKVENMKKISAVIGVDFELEYDAFAIYKALTDEKYKIAFPLHITDSYLENIAKGLTIAFAEPLVKEEFLKHTSAHKLLIRVADYPVDKSTDVNKNFGGSSYMGYVFESGVWVLQIPAKNWWCNVNQLSNNKDISLAMIFSRCHTPEGQLPLNLRIATRDTEAARAAAVKKISAALGLDMQLEFDPMIFYNEIPVANRDNFPHASGKYLDGLGTNLEKCCKDSMVKEAVQEACKQKKVGFTLIKGTFPDAKKYGGDTYVGISFEGGNLHVVIPTNNFWCNMDNISKIKIESML